MFHILVLLIIHTFLVLKEFTSIWLFSFYEFENDERIIETSFKIIFTNFYSELFVQNLRY